MDMLGNADDLGRREQKRSTVFSPGLDFHIERPGDSSFLAPAGAIARTLPARNPTRKAIRGFTLGRVLALVAADPHPRRHGPG